MLAAKQSLFGDTQLRTAKGWLAMQCSLHLTSMQLLARQRHIGFTITHVFCHQHAIGMARMLMGNEGTCVMGIQKSYV